MAQVRPRIQDQAQVIAQDRIARPEDTACPRGSIREVRRMPEHVVALVVTETVQSQQNTLADLQRFGLEVELDVPLQVLDERLHCRLQYFPCRVDRLLAGRSHGALDAWTASVGELAR